MTNGVIAPTLQEVLTSIEHEQGEQFQSARIYSVIQVLQKLAQAYSVDPLISLRVDPARGSKRHKYLAEEAQLPRGGGTQTCEKLFPLKI